MTNDIVEIASAAGNFKTLATALRAADLESTLKGKGPYTVFAPTDAASGEEVTLGLKNNQVTVNGAVVSKTDIQASNGIIHAIDTVIMTN